MTREEEIRQASQEFARSIASIRPELNADSFRRGAEWADSNPPKGTSLIKWHTGEPKENGIYLVTYRFGYYPIENPMERIYDISIGTSYWDSFWHNYDDESSDCRIIAWCKLSDIEPYKRKDDGIIPF